MARNRNDEALARAAAEEAARKKLQFFLFLTGAVVLVAAMAFFLPKKQDAPDTTSTRSSSAAPLSEDEMGRILENAPGAARKSEAEQARETIANHQAKLDADPEAAEAPALLNAMGNLYRQKLGDYAKAAEQYETLLFRFPDWDKKAQVYPQLATCYDLLNEPDKKRALCREMLEVFEPGTNEYEWAQDALGQRVEGAPEQ